MEYLINFRDGIITYENLFWLFKYTPHEAIDQLEFEEDLLQVSFFDEKYILDGIRILEKTGYLKSTSLKIMIGKIHYLPDLIEI